MVPLLGDMGDAMESSLVCTKQQRMAELARIHPTLSFTSLSHHIDMAWMQDAYGRTRKDGATGVDGVTAKEYESDLEGNLQRLLERFKSGSYVAPPVRRAMFRKAMVAAAKGPLVSPLWRTRFFSVRW